MPTNNPPGLEDLALSLSYTSGRTDLEKEFFVPCLSRAAAYDRAVGFFSSSLYAAVSAALAGFVERGGKIRLVCSPHLSANDVEAIERGISLRERIQENLVDDIRALTSDPQSVPAVELLSTLIGAGFLDIRIAYRPGKPGIFHSKVGIFSTEDSCGGVRRLRKRIASGFQPRRQPRVILGLHFLG